MFHPIFLVIASLLLAAPAVAAEGRSLTATPGDLVPVKGAWLIHDVRYVSGPSFRKLLAQ
jgi:hypothetical protein